MKKEVLDENDGDVLEGGLAKNSHHRNTKVSYIAKGKMLEADPNLERNIRSSPSIKKIPVRPKFLIYLAEKNQWKDKGGRFFNGMDGSVR